jgi:hypothetical protein
LIERQRLALACLGREDLSFDRAEREDRTREIRPDQSRCGRAAEQAR